MSKTVFYTKELTTGNSFNITESMNVQRVSIMCTSGTATITGTGNLDADAPEALTLSAGQSVSLQANDSFSPLEINITSNGTVNIIVNQ